MRSFIESYLDRSYHLALVITSTGVVALFIGRMSGGEFVTLGLGVVGAFRIGDSLIQWLRKDPPETDPDKKPEQGK